MAIPHGATIVLTSVALAFGAANLSSLPQLPSNGISPPGDQLAVTTTAIRPNQIRSFTSVTNSNPATLQITIPGGTNNGFILTDVIIWRHTGGEEYTEFTLTQGTVPQNVAHFLTPGSAGVSSKFGSYHFESGIPLVPGQPLGITINAPTYGNENVYVTLSGYIF